MSIDERYFDVFIESSASGDSWPHFVFSKYVPFIDNSVYHKLYYHKEANYFYVCR